MTVNSRAKGARAEVELVKLIGDLSGFHMARTRTPGQAADIGDLSGLPGCVVEAKNMASIAAAVNEALPQARAAAERLGVPYPTAWIRRPRGRWFVALDPDIFLALLREATGPGTGAA